MRSVRSLACCWIFACLAHPAVADDLGHDDWGWRGQPEATDASKALALQGPAWLQMVSWQVAAADGSHVAAAPGAAGPSSRSSKEGDPVQERWSDFLPLWGKELREQGYKLPLPFGVSIMGAGIWQDTLQENLKLSFDPGSPPIDTGLRRMAVTRTGADRGKLLECAVHLDLRRRGLNPAYWRGRGEVDFVVTTDRGITPIQVSWERSADRHHRALEEFYETFPQAQEALLVGPVEFEAGALAELAPAL